MPVTDESPEDRFLRYARERDARDLDALLQEHVARCYAQARRITGRDHLAEEAVQEACLKLISTARRYDGSVPFAAWLGQLVANAAIDQLRSSRRRARHERASSLDALAPGVVAEDERFDLLRTALDELPERYRRPLVIHFVTGLDHEQTAKALGVPTGTVAARISRGKDRLRARLARAGALAGAVTLAELAASPASAAPATLGPVVSVSVLQGTAALTGVGALIAAHPLASAGIAALVAAAAATPFALDALRPQVTRAAAAAPAPAPAEVLVRLGDDLQAAIDAHPPSTRFRIAAGIHRLQSASPKDGDIFTGDAGAVLSGARVLTDFRSDGGRWRIDGQTQQGQVHGMAEADWPGAVYPEDLFVDDAPLTHVRALADLAPGRWYFDYDADRIWMADDPAGHRVETSVARCAFHGAATHVGISHLVIEKYAIPAQMGAIGEQYPPADWTITDCELRLNHGTGIAMGARWSVTDCRIHDNGQKGIGGSGPGLRVERCELVGNNYAHYAMGWEAGGAKFGGTTGMIVRDNRVIANHGDGLRFESEVIDARIEGNVVTDNERGGISLMTSARAVIARNHVRRNAPTPAAAPWLWGAQILLRDSTDVEVADNAVEVAAAGGNAIGLIQQDCGDGPRGPYRTVRNRVHDNDVVFRGAAGAAGCAADFDPLTMDAGGNVFDANRYHAPDPTVAHWSWSGAPRTWSELRALGQEAHGSIDAILPP